MRIKLKNIAKVKTADIDIKGITVIAGENNSGKSTIGKALFSVFYALNNIKDKYNKDQYASLKSILQRFYLTVYFEYPINQISQEVFNPNINESQLIQKLLGLTSKGSTLKVDIESILRFGFSDMLLKSMDIDSWNELIQEIIAVLSVEIKKYINFTIAEQLKGEFNQQIVNIFEETSGDILFEQGKQNIIINVDSNNNISTNIVRWNDIAVEPIYIDNPFIIDDVFTGAFINFTTYKNHRNNLLAQLTTSKSINKIDSIVNSNKLNSIMESINKILPGTLDISESGLSYFYNEKRLDAKNLSTGIKTFAVIKRLISNGYISTNGIVILDEPEIHLHPEWQLVLAELIVLLQKEFNLHILITTHSPYFLNAIEVYVAKHNINDKCKYYLSNLIKNDKYVKFDDVSDKVDLIYKKLAKPLQELENMRYRL